MNKAVVYISVGAITVCSAYIYFSYRKKKSQCTCKNRVEKKVIAITGANSGIGYEAALQFASYGAKVYIACRNKSLALEAISKIKAVTGSEEVYFLFLDLCDLDSCKEFVQTFIDTVGKLDILIHNAGIFNAPSKLTQDGFEIHMQTNFLAPISVTHSLLPLLHNSRSPKIIFSSSEAHKLVSVYDILNVNFRRPAPTRNFEDSIKHYGVSKLALKLYAAFFSHIRKTQPPLNVYSVNPGNVWTNVYRNCWKRWYQWPLRLFISMCMKSPRQGAQGLVHAANCADLKNGCYISDCREVHPFVTLNEINFTAKHFPEFSKNILNINL